MTITIHRPEVRNAIDEQTARGLAAALEEPDPDPAGRTGPY
jgi:enoyl-CoA hydratase/carnithine racemase